MRIAEDCLVSIQPALSKQEALHFTFPLGKHPGKGEDVWLDFGPLGWVRIALRLVMRGEATYAAVEWRSADSEAPPRELLWSASSRPLQGGL